MHFYLLGMHLSAEWEDEKLKEYYDKYAPMLTIHVGNHFSDKFVPLCHLDYFINGDEPEVNCQIYFSHFLFFQELNFVFSSFRDAFASELHIEGQK